MPLSENTRTLLLNIIAVSPIMKRFMLPGIVGMLLAGAGLWQEMDWLVITGLVLAAPILWCYMVVALIYPIMLLFEKLLGGPPKRHWEE